MPRPVQLAILLLVGSMIPGWFSSLSGVAATVTIVATLIMAAIVAAIVLRYAAVRIVLAILLLVGIASLIMQWLAGQVPPPLGVGVTLAQLLATGLLFHPLATAWFRSRRASASTDNSNP